MLTEIDDSTAEFTYFLNGLMELHITYVDSCGKSAVDISEIMRDPTAKDKEAEADPQRMYQKVIERKRMLRKSGHEIIKRSFFIRN